MGLVAGIPGGEKVEKFSNVVNVHKKKGNSEAELDGSWIT